MMTAARFKTVALAGAVLLLSGCASVPPGAGTDPSDPWEKLNRQTFAMNMTIDEYAFRPVAKAYINVVPEPVRNGVSRATSNLGEPSNAINNALQGKGENALVSVFRFLINTTLGLGGIFDVADTAGGQKEKSEDFGQTLNVWGVPQGPYFVIPFMGPSTVTDAVGKGVDIWMTPQTYLDDHWYKWTYAGVAAVDMRASAMPATDLMRDAVDPYLMARQGFISMRRNQIYDGNPPMQLTVDEFEDEDEAESKAPAAK